MTHAYLKLSLLGGHLGRDKTYNKVADRYHWKCMYKDIEAYIRTCEVCQKTNDVKFMKATAPLHPIPVAVTAKLKMLINAREHTSDILSNLIGRN